MLKPLDTLVALKYASLVRSDLMHLGMREIGESIGISGAEVSRSSQRLFKASLLSQKDFRLLTLNLKEWIEHGIRYAIPLEVEGFGRGMASGFDCPLLESNMVAKTNPWVWRSNIGSASGNIIKPIYKTVPIAADNDKWLYQLLSVVDIFRGGKPREIREAKPLLAMLLDNA
ncbi:MAG: hypothetical protein COA99_19145 [Moraxellaceae bacterium]|nr:MAG: hypothetical protein COA99_19145 [Moraxellaceae bacterium]